MAVVPYPGKRVPRKGQLDVGSEREVIDMLEGRADGITSSDGLEIRAFDGLGADLGREAGSMKLLFQVGEGHRRAVLLADHLLQDIQACTIPIFPWSQQEQALRMFCMLDEAVTEKFLNLGDRSRRLDRLQKIPFPE